MQHDETAFTLTVPAPTCSSADNGDQRTNYGQHQLLQPTLAATASKWNGFSCSVTASRCRETTPNKHPEAATIQGEYIHLWYKGGAMQCPKQQAPREAAKHTPQQQHERATGALHAHQSSKDSSTASAAADCQYILGGTHGLTQPPHSTTAQSGSVQHHAMPCQHQNKL
jgi:hypothetical protein